MTLFCPGHDVVVLARTLKEESEVWVSFGTRKAFCFLAHEIAGLWALRKLRHYRGFML